MKRSTIIAIVVPLAIIAIGLVMFTQCGSPAKVEHNQASAPPSSSPPPSQTAAAKTAPSARPSDPAIAVPAQQRKAIRAVVKDIPAHPKKHVAKGFEELFEGGIDDAIPPGSVIVVDEKTWTRVDDHTVFVNAALKRQGSPDEVYTLIMVEVKGKWKIAGTLQPGDDQQQ